MTETNEKIPSEEKKDLSLKDVYNNKIVHENFMRDISQEEVIEEFSRLLEQIKSGSLPKVTKGSLISKLFNVREVSRRKLKGVYLYGESGRGKSFLMDLFYNVAAVDKKRRCHFPEFMSDIHDALHVYRQKGIGSDKAIPILAEQLVKENRLLCLDDVYVSEIEDAMILGRLFSEMFDAGLVLVATANFKPEEQYRDGIQQDRFLPFVEQIKEHTKVCSLSGKIDYRIERLRTRPVYYTPVSAETRELLDGIFDDLTQYDAVEKKTLTVKGHLLHIPKASVRVARFTFQQLCGQPKGASDYLSLARHYECIVLEGVPIFESDHSDLVKRFILMVDAFYEKKVKLIISADASPEELYKKGRLKSEYSRTVKLLLEMQSIEYIETQHHVS